MDAQFIAIDLKSFYASVECVSRRLNPLTTNLVVADESRTEKTICLAVSPSLKSYGISGRARLFEVVQRVKEVNVERLRRARSLGLSGFTAVSSDAPSLAEDPALEAGYIAAPPRMQLYEEISRRVFSIYMKYVSSEDIHVYSIDECFIDVTGYLKTYNLSARSLAVTMIREVLRETGITATAGIGSNLYLAKIAMDIVAKPVPADRDGVRIAELNERTYRELLWCHTPLTDFWRVGRGIARTLSSLGCRTMGDVARLSLTNEAVLYDALGVNAELLIDHAWGWEPARIADIKAYKPEETSISSGQVLSEPYDSEKAKLIVREMTELLVLDLVRKGVVTKKITLTLGYDRSSLVADQAGSSHRAVPRYLVAKTGKPYRGKVKPDPYGRPQPEHAHGTGNIDRWTSSTKRIMAVMMDLYNRIVDPDLLIRRLWVVACNLVPEDQVPAERPVQLDLFTDYAALAEQKKVEDAADLKEKRLQKAALAMHEKFGKNAVLKGMNLQAGATTIQRNGQIGGHRAGTLPAEGDEPS